VWNGCLLYADNTKVTSLNWLIKVNENDLIIWDEKTGLNSGTYQKININALLAQVQLK
jgi:hypothetical protein